MQLYGILSFPTLFTAKASKDAAGNPSGDPKFSCALLIPPNDPQLPMIQAEFNKALQDTFPSGLPSKADVCFNTYRARYHGKDYYDPRFENWYVFSCTAKEDAKPTVVNSTLTPVMDPSKVFAGAMVWVHANMSGYTKGTGGIGGWLNGVMITDDESTMGRLDNKPSAEQMFGALPTSHQTHLAAGQTVARPTVVVPPVLIAKPAALLLMKPGLASYQDHIAAGYTDEMLIERGMATRPLFA